MDLWQVLLSGAVGAALIKLLDNIVQWKLQRKAKKEDEAVQEKTDLEKKVDALENAMMALLLDRIQSRCEKYIGEGSVDPDDLRRLHIMHEIYHEAGGNGDLDKLIGRTEALPLKIKH